MARGSTLNVSLTTALDRYVRDKVKSGAYESASEVIRESLRRSKAMERSEQLFWSQARAKLAVARKQVARGQFLDGEVEMDRLINELSDSPQKAKRR